MKRSISLLSALAFVLMFSGSVFAQVGSVDVTASATIQTQLTFNEVSDLSFGKIPSNFSGVEISPTDNGSGGTDVDNNTGTGSSLGEVAIESGSSSASLLVTINSPTTLDASSSSIGFNADYVGEDGTDLSSASDASVATIDQGGSSYSYTVYLGGSLDDPGTDNSDASFDSESHSGLITLEVDYQ